MGRVGGKCYVVNNLVVRVYILKFHRKHKVSYLQTNF